ncbi:MAG: hypothetical protein A3E36_02490 [Candidatus Andersenbacteria bacterium RIFCSPHIGHO2_12_FULL_45_11b]|uniref:Uncharacterized protein n=1 Tax=Candidatus Andersenbacteria bacterium RIFCSPHIGHO2_12_FULL_45_11b TaxID=1797282 RepID=A0A1G1XDF9_9BACT|nr:MAG: hypothetical protein A3E36_02490 [Candidatus Andersenbacteria bacterium RIFCSPHIGHO2_12_FULL_45_11b]
MSARPILGLKKVPRVWLFANEKGTRAGFKPYGHTDRGGLVEQSTMYKLTNIGEVLTIHI